MKVRELPVLDIRAVAKILGDAQDKPPLRPKTVSQYLVESREGGRYEKNPFPKPDGYIGKSPWWARGREPEFLKWHGRRTGQGIGGGRPRNDETR